MTSSGSNSDALTTMVTLNIQPLLSVSHGKPLEYFYYPGAGTVNSDTLCMDATDTKIVVAGYNSQKVSRDQSVMCDGQSVPGLGVQH